MSYTHLSIIERSQLDILNRQGWTARAIAKEIGRHYSTVAREIKRNQVEAFMRQESLNEPIRIGVNAVYP